MFDPPHFIQISLQNKNLELNIIIFCKHLKIFTFKVDFTQFHTGIQTKVLKKIIIFIIL